MFYELPPEVVDQDVLVGFVTTKDKKDEERREEGREQLWVIMGPVRNLDETRESAKSGKRMSHVENTRNRRDSLSFNGQDYSIRHDNNKKSSITAKSRASNLTNQRCKSFEQDL